MKIVYIVSLSHSGSTVLDIMLSKHPEIVGMGEIYAVLNKKEKTLAGTENFCSCGHILEECPLWSKYFIWEKDNRLKSYKEKYKYLLKVAASHGKQVIVDSSKHLKYLKEIKELVDSTDFNLKVIFLIRDVRGWAASRYDIAKN